MNLFYTLEAAINKYSDKNALYIKGFYYSYLDLAAAISKIRSIIQQKGYGLEKIIGLIANEDIDTYAAIIALWMEGKAYVPISPTVPMDRNIQVISQAGLKTIIDSEGIASFGECTIIKTSTLPAAEMNLHPKKVSNQELVYLLFTSGTTGIPKGVPITRANLAAFVEAFEALNIEVSEADRCLQMFELTFDLSVMSYLIPFLKGACIYPVPRDRIKYECIYEIMDVQKITIALMVPSILHYLRPYFDEIDFPQMRYSLFCGEALSLDITKEWSKCLPNAVIMNVYGPTEDTIFCTHYIYDRNSTNKSYNGILSIGKAMKDTQTIIIDEDKRILQAGEAGELCLSGVQLTSGYWNDDEKNAVSFFCTESNGVPTKFYKTGDRCHIDKTGDIFYSGRLDFQIKIQGFRVELAEIEFQSKVFLDKLNVIAIAFENRIGNTEIGLVIEADDFEIGMLTQHLMEKLPAYMIPKQIIFEKSFPLNVNGKTDRKELKKRFAELNNEKL